MGESQKHIVWSLFFPVNVFSEAWNEKVIKLSLKRIYITVKPIGCLIIEYNTFVEARK